MQEPCGIDRRGNGRRWGKAFPIPPMNVEWLASTLPGVVNLCDGRLFEVGHELRYRIDAVAEAHRENIPAAIDEGGNERGHQHDAAAAKARRSALHRAGHDLLRLRLRLQPERQHGEERHPPDDEIDGEIGEELHGRSFVRAAGLLR